MVELEAIIAARAALGAAAMENMPRAPDFPKWKLCPSEQVMIVLIRNGEKEGARLAKRGVANK